MNNLDLQHYLDRLNTILEKLAPNWFAKHPNTIYDIITLVAGIVEYLSANMSNLDSDAKLNLAIQFLPIAIDRLVSMGYLTQDVADVLKAFAQNTGMVTNVINLMISIANHPNFLQASTWVKAKVGCC